jgi:hypothetical protein
MVLSLGVMMVMVLITAASFSAVQGDIPLNRRDIDRKQAYAAAEAGVNDYLFHLSQNNAYWSLCTGVPSPNAVNQPWNGSGADPRSWRSIPEGAAQYTIELLPANGAATCNPANPEPSMVDAASKTIRIRATGRSRGVKRSIIGVFKRRGFLDYLYFTDFETLDPAWYIRDVSGAPTTPDLTTWASTACATYWRSGRGNQTYTGAWFDVLNLRHNFTDTCKEITFIDSDHVDGPLHTNDSLQMCGSPRFGRNAQDAVEVSAPTPGWRAGCSATPNFVGRFAVNSPILTLPPSDGNLRQSVLSGYTFTGQTTIVLSGATMTVNGVSTALPANGLIYVKNGACGRGYVPYAPYTDPAGCANVYVRGTYSTSLTIASEKDVIVNGNLTHTGSGLLGLVANNFVRVYHPTTTPNSSGACTNQAGTMSTVTIDAAILSLQHSFTVDNYFCGAALSSLVVNGVIAQKFRGPVGTSSGGTVISGYSKAYAYDDRLAFRSPPYFLDPLQANWRIRRQSEQVPAR